MSDSDDFFQHRPAPPSPPGHVVVNEATRLMCIGAYIEPSYARAVVEELVENEARAVVPSSGYDVGPVLRHCFQASRMEVRRDLLLTAVLAVGAVFGCVSPFVNTPITPIQSIVDFVLPALVVVVAGFAVDLYFRHRWYRILTRSLASGARQKLPPLPGGRVGRRVTAVSAAQWGNLTLQANSSLAAFLGAGVAIQSWSMCLELKSRSRPGNRVVIDSYDMHTSIRRALEAMRRDPLPENEKVTGLVVTDHVLARGMLREDSGLIDTRYRVPYAEVTPEAIAAIIRHPQGSLRYYLRVIVGAEGKQIETPDGRIVAAAQDQEITVSTFLYIAVEGGLLYAEFLAMIMPPIRPEFRVFDRIPPDSVLRRSVREVLPSFIFDVVRAPFRLMRGAVAEGTARRMDEAARACRNAYVYDYGAHRSIREMAAADDLGDYLQQLDGQKYYKLVERTVTASMLEYLRRYDVDTAEYEARVNQIHNHSVIISGGTFHGPVAAGTDAKASAGAPA